MTTREAVDAIIEDMTSRRGFGQTWWNLDEEIQDEIREAWYAIVAKVRNMKP